jgi:hypothetical protein
VLLNIFGHGVRLEDLCSEGNWTFPLELTELGD